MTFGDDNLREFKPKTIFRKSTVVNLKKDSPSSETLEPRDYDDEFYEIQQMEMLKERLKKSAKKRLAMLKERLKKSAKKRLASTRKHLAYIEKTYEDGDISEEEYDDLYEFTMDIIRGIRKTIPLSNPLAGRPGTKRKNVKQVIEPKKDMRGRKKKDPKLCKMPKKEDGSYDRQAYHKTNPQPLTKIVKCECGASVRKKYLAKHKTMAKHIRDLELNDKYFLLVEVYERGPPGFRCHDTDYYFHEMTDFSSYESELARARVSHDHEYNEAYVRDHWVLKVDEYAGTLYILKESEFIEFGKHNGKVRCDSSNLYTDRVLLDRKEYELVNGHRIEQRGDVYKITL